MPIELSALPSAMPKMLSGEELVTAMSVLPEYNPAIAFADNTTRLLTLSELYKVYIPAPMSIEIYEKLYIALMRALQKKGSKLSVIQQNENHRVISEKVTESRGIIGGADSFTIIGESGIGKSSAIERAIAMITGNRVIVAEQPYCKVIPCVTVQCPFDSSVKGLLLEILRKVDEAIGTRYYESALRARSTTDMLIGSVSQVALNHIGMLIVDEIQNCVNSRNGRSLVGMLTQLINSSGISICMVGTPESAVFFEQAMQLARRSLGLSYGVLPFDDFFCEMCRLLFSYRYVRHGEELTETMLSWLYEHTRGIVALLVALIHDAQEIAILSGSESLDLQSLEEAYRQRLTMMHGYLAVEPLPGSSTVRSSRSKKKVAANGPKKDADVHEKQEDLIATLAKQAKVEKKPMSALLIQHGLLEEVAV